MRAEGKQMAKQMERECEVENTASSCSCTTSTDEDCMAGEWDAVAINWTGRRL